MNLMEYMNGGIERIVRKALKSSLKNPRESAFLLRYMIAQKDAVKKRNQLESQGTHIPSFLIASITTQCNLFCKGCYARANQSCSTYPQQEKLTCDQWKRIFQEANQLGISFILLAGGEPLLSRGIIETAAEFPDVIFPIFTNGTIMDESYIDLFDKNRNLVPVFSMEGGLIETDKRRGEGVYTSLVGKMEQMNTRGIFYGTSITVTMENLDVVTSKEFIDTLYKKGCGIVFYVEYVPAEPSTENLVLTEGGRKILEERQDILRKQYEDIIYLSFPGDEKYMGGCLAAGRGFFHINTAGRAEPCPFSPYSDMNLKDCSLLEALQSPLFQKLNTQGLMNEEHEGGCVLFGKQDEIRKLLGYNDTNIK